MVSYAVLDMITIANHDNSLFKDVFPPLLPSIAFIQSIECTSSSHVQFHIYTYYPMVRAVTLLYNLIC